jgi:diaminohydroxyphosphoribosylaminopyrimidine deaminase / 5-amino-6-(5-phosphoribosylamino)uracil reductase
MLLAISLANKAPNPSPNPKVGCVILQNDKVVGEGFHEKAGKPHAEIIALKKAGKRAEGATLFVTLEPCNHQGKTPPCSHAIVKAGVKKVVVGMRDFSRAKGGVEFLRKNGVEVKTGVLQKECEDLNQIWLKNVKKQLPYLTLKLALDADGSSIPKKGRWITNTASRREVMKMRREHDAILVGTNTIIADNPRLTVRGLKIAQQPWRIILGQKKVPKLRPGGRALFVKKLNLKKLYKLGITSIFVEGGETTAKKLIDQELIDKVFIFQKNARGIPKVCGKKLALKKVKNFGGDTLFEVVLKKY